MNTEARTRRWMNALFVLSGAVLTLMLTLNYSVFVEYISLTDPDPGYRIILRLAPIAAALMIPAYLFVARRMDLPARVLRESGRHSLVMSGVMTALLAAQMMLDCQKNYTHILDAAARYLHGGWFEAVGTKLVLALGCALAAWALFVFVAYVRDLLARFMRDFIGEADAFEKYYFAITMVAFSALIFYVYQRTRIPWHSIDTVYQTDTIYMAQQYYPTFSYGYGFDFDIGCGGIRHPLATLLTFPIHVACTIVANFLPFLPYAQKMLYAIVHVALMAMSAIALKRMTKSIWTALVFTVSFPFVLYAVMLEKYPIAVFMAVMFAYCVHRRRKNAEQQYFLIAAGGMMVTSCFLGFFYGSGRTLKQRLKEYLGAGLGFLGALVASGRLYYITGYGYLSSVNFTRFADVQWTHNNFQTRFAGLTNLMASIFVPIESEVRRVGRGRVYYWTQAALTHVNILGVAVLAAAVIAGVLLWRRHRGARVFLHWILLAAIQELALGIGIGADPLFCLYFAWAVLPLVIMGVNAVLRRPALRACVYVPVMLALAYLNIENGLNLIQFMIRELPA